MISNFAGRGIPQPFQQQTTVLSVGLDWQQNAQVPTASPDVFDFEEVKLAQIGTTICISIAGLTLCIHSVPA
jgi:hypothetical protein